MSIIPLWLKISYTFMVIIIVPVYWVKHGPSNFLWLSDIALLTMVPALWFENALIPSMMAIGVVPLEFLWIIDFISGGKLLHLAKYMFDPTLPLYLRGLSLFHIPLPFVILYSVHRLGYDNNALVCQVILVLCLLPLSYWLTPLKENINWVHGLGEKPQTLFPPLVYLTLLMIAMPLILNIPMHFLLKWLFSETGKF